jgi:hypothetical protein
VVQQQMIEKSALDLESGGLPGEASVAKDEFERFAGIAKMKLSAKLRGEANNDSPI